MEYLSLQSTINAVFLGGFICTLVALFAAVLIPFASDDEDQKVRFALAGGLAAIATIVAGFITVGNIRADERELQLLAMSDRYGWTPTSDQLRELEYPTREPEPGVPDLYGHTEITIDGDAFSVQLAWDGEKLALLDMSDAKELSLTD